MYRALVSECGSPTSSSILPLVATACPVGCTHSVILRTGAISRRGYAGVKPPRPILEHDVFDFELLSWSSFCRWGRRLRGDSTDTVFSPLEHLTRLNIDGSSFGDSGVCLEL